MGGRDRIRNRNILVTGASSGIGRAAALQLAARGARVIAVARRAEELRDLQAEADGDIATYPVDLADLDALDAAADAILDQFGRVDVLVNNAGRSIRRPVTEQLDRFHDFERCMQINYFAAVRLTLKLLPPMLEAGDGHIVNVLTWGTLVPSPRFSAYIGSKSALEGFSRSIGAELQPRGIDVTTVHYPLVYTPMIEPAADHYRHMRGLSPEQAGAWIVKAIRKRPARVAPGYAVIGGAHAFAFPKITEWIAGRFPF